RDGRHRRQGDGRTAREGPPQLPCPSCPALGDRGGRQARSVQPEECAASPPRSLGAGTGRRLRFRPPRTSGGCLMERIFLETKILADAAGAVSGLAWKFGVPDRIGDWIEPGAFKGAK